MVTNDAIITVVRNEFVFSAKRLPFAYVIRLITVANINTYEPDDRPPGRISTAVAPLLLSYIDNRIFV